MFRVYIDPDIDCHRSACGCLERKRFKSAASLNFFNGISAIAKCVASCHWHIQVNQNIPGKRVIIGNAQDLLANLKMK